MDARTVRKIASNVEPVAYDGNRVVRWVVPCTGSCGGSEHGHYVWRLSSKSNRFACDCPAGQYGRPCGHVTAVLKSEFAFLFHSAVSVWRDEVAARRQRRKTWTAWVGGHKLWLTERKNGVIW